MTERAYELPQKDGYTALVDLFKISAQWVFYDFPDDPCRDRCGEYDRNNRADLHVRELLARDLQSGLLTALVVDHDPMHTEILPRWVWSRNDRAASGLMFGGLSVSHILPCKYHAWQGMQAYVKFEDAHRWFSSLPHTMKDWPILQPGKSEIERPPYETSRPLPDDPYVSLTQAVTWLAFGFSLTEHEVMDFALDDLGIDPDTFEERTSAALKTIINTALVDGVRITGKREMRYKSVSNRERLTDEELQDIRSWRSYGDRLCTTAANTLPRDPQYLDVTVQNSPYLRAKMQRGKEISARTIGLVGRPVKLTPKIMSQYKARLKSGMADQNLAVEASFLIEWATKEFPDQLSQIPGKKYIREQLGRFRKSISKTNAEK